MKRSGFARLLRIISRLLEGGGSVQGREEVTQFLAGLLEVGIKRPGQLLPH